MSRLCFVGLGNPGPRYQGTRHNIGFSWIDAVASALFPKTKFTEKYQSLWLESSFSGSNEDFEVHFLKPQTYMNESGRAVAEWASKHQGAFTLVVIYDDMDLPIGKLRVRATGSDGGHRGMKSVIERLGTKDIPRLRIGVGRPSVEGQRNEVLEHVLEKFEPEELKTIEKILKDAPEQFKILANETDEAAMNQINARTFT